MTTDAPTDLTGGLPLAREYVFPEAPTTPLMRDAVNMWVSDDQGEIGLPRFAVEAAMPDWDHHEIQVNLAFPDGRVYRVRGPFDSHRPKLNGDGLAYTFGSGPLSFECEAPFDRWTTRFSGRALETTTQAQIAGEPPGDAVDLEFEVTATMAVPPWVQGTLFPEAAEMLANSVEGKLMGGPRYEQLFRAEGAVRVAGAEHPFAGSGLRIRRQGVRDITEFWGHCWQSALFPSGRGFGFIAYPDRPDGSPSYNEGYLYLGHGDLIPAKVVDAPWLHRLEPNGQDVSFTLESELGTTRVEGETVVSTFELGLPEYPQFPVLTQGGVRYTWDGEVTHGMLERSSMRDRIDWS
jgi:hypothetical protein